MLTLAKKIRKRYYEAMPNVKVSTATVNLPTKRAMIEGVAGHEDFLGKTGYDGFEVQPMRSRFCAELLLGTKATRLVTSWHQSFPGVNMRDLAKGAVGLGDEKPNAQRIKIVAGMPDRLRSMKYLRAMQAKIKQKLPAVLYPSLGTLRSYGYDHRDYQGVFAERLWQPHAEVLHYWGVLPGTTTTVIRGMLRAMQAAGLDNLCVDTSHWNARWQGLTLPPWQAALPHLATKGHVREVHFGPARTDLGNDVSQLKLILDGKIAQTESGKMLRTIAENTPGAELYVVTELTHAAITAAGYTDYQTVHREVCAAVRETVENP